MLDGLFGGGCAPKCKSLIKRMKSRIDILRKKRTSKANILRHDVAQLIMKGDDHSAFLRVERLLIELSLLHGYNMIESFCDSILKQLSYIQKQKECPHDVREAVSSLIFAAARCADLPELQGLRNIFATKYGNDFAVAAVELFPDCGVNQQMREKILATAISSDAKLKIMKEIAEEAGFPWDPSNLQDGSQGLQGFRSSHNETPLYHHHPLSDESPMDGTRIRSLNNNGTYSKSSNTAKKHEGAVLNRRVEMASRSVGCEEDICDTDAAGHEDSLNKPCIKQTMDDRAFDASSERQKDNRNPRYSPTRPRTNKTSRHISSAEGNDLKGEYSNGSSDTRFPKEGNGLCERGSGLRPTEPIKSDTAYKSRTSRRASHLVVDIGEPQELSGVPENRKLEDNCAISRRAPTGINNDLNRLDANGVRAGSHGMHSKASHLMVDKEEPWEFSERPENKKLQDNCSIPRRESIGTPNVSNGFETNGVWAGSHRMHGKTSHLMADREEPQEFSERPENKKLQDNCSIPRRESIGTNNSSSRFETNGVWAGSQRTHGTGSVHGDQDDELKRFNRPVWDVNAGQESELYDVPQTRSKAKPKSSKILYNCAVENRSLNLSENDSSASRSNVANRVNQLNMEPSIKKSLGRKQYSEHYLESRECFTSNRSSLHSLDKSESTWKHREDKASYKAYNGSGRPYNRIQYCDDEDSDDSNFARNENLNAVCDGLSQAHERVSSRASRRRVNYVDNEASFDDARHTSRRASLEPQHREVGTVQERVSGGESSRRVNYVDEEATFDDARQSSRKASTKNTNFGKLRSYEGVNNFQQSEHEGKYETYYSEEQRLQKFYENSDSYLISVDRLTSEPQCRKEGTVQERVSSRKSSRRVNYVDEEATFDDAKHGPRRTSDKGNNFGKFSSYEGVNNFGQLEHVGKYETYLSQKQRLHENNPISVDSLPSERQHEEEDTKLGKHVFRANHKLHGLNEPSTRKNLNQTGDHYSDLEAQVSRQSDYTKEYTKPKYLENSEAWKRPNGSRRTHERKTQKETDNLVDSLNIYDMENHNSNPEGRYLRENENPESYVKETSLAGEKPERKHSHRRHRHEGRLPNGNIKLSQCNEGYSANKEQLSDGLDDEYEGKVSSEKHYRYDKQHCGSKQKVHHTSGDSNVGIVREANSFRHYSEQDEDHQSFGGRHAIPEVECSPARGKRHDIQDANSCTTRNTQSASHWAQSHNHNQSVYSEYAIVEKHSRSMMPSNQEVRDSCDSPHDFSVNGCDAPPSPKPSVPAWASVLPESLSQAKPQYGKVSGSPPRRPAWEQQRAVSLPAEYSHSTPLHPNFSKSSSDVGPCQMVHVHPKLPDYDDLAARFAALKQQSKTK